jgi:hypothetical protein
LAAADGDGPAAALTEGSMSFLRFWGLWLMMTAVLVACMVAILGIGELIMHLFGKGTLAFLFFLVLQSFLISGLLYGLYRTSAGDWVTAWMTRLMDGMRRESDKRV